MRGNGERIGPQNLPTSSIAGGIWNLLNQQRAQQRGAWPSATPAVVTDPYFMYVPLLLNTTSTNGQQNNTFLDSSTNNFTITRNGTPTQGAFTPYQPSGYWSGYFGATSDYFNTASGAGVANFGTGNFTFEGWYYITETIQNSSYFIIVDTNTTGIYIGYDTAGTISIGQRNTATNNSVSYTFPLNQWIHFAVARSGTTIKIFINGAEIFSGTNSIDYSGTGTAYFGRLPAVSASIKGYYSNIRIVKGTAIYTAAFTPPTSPLTAITNTSLLTLQSNRFIDNSTNAFAITANGTPKVQAFQPFSPAASYSAATYGGSGYFNGSTDSIYTSQTFSLPTSTTPFTMEAWVYFNAFTTTAIASTAYSGSAPLPFIMGIGPNFTGAPGSNPWFGYYNGSTWTIPIQSATNLSANTWYHLAYVYTGTSATIYANGVSIGTASVSSWPNTSQAGFYVGRRWDAAAFTYFSGYISNFRLVIGTAVYTGAFTPPTLAPLTTAGSTSAASYPSTTNVNTSFAAANTSLLTNFTNAGIYDAAWQNDALTVGDAQVSTTQKQWGTTSMKFDGTGDYLDILGPNPAFNLTSGDWTIEAWIYRSVANANHCVLNLINASGSNSGLSFYVNSSNQLATDNGTVAALSGGTVPANQWVYLAIVRSSGTTTGYVNGTSIGTTTQAPATAQYARIGALGGGGSPFNGYIQDLRITKGVARTITTPTAAFPTR